MLHGANASLASNLSQLKYVVIDEISMVGSNFFWEIHQKLKQVMGSEEYFGGVSVIATGDFHQLPPVANPWIFNPTRIHGRANATATNIWKVYFQMYKLSQHVRSENDPLYSKLQEEISVGEVSEETLAHLTKRVEAKCETEDNNDWYKNGKQVMITSTHQIKDRFNTKQLLNLEGDLIKFPAKDIHSKRMQTLPDLSNLHEQKTKGLLTDLNIKKDCPIKITVNINKKDSLVNGTFGYVCDIEEEQGIIWCIFPDKIGSSTRRNSERKHATFKKAVPIVRISEQVKLTVDGKQYTFKRTQFPLVVAYAITSYASQGITKERVIIDYGDNKQKHALFSVPFSRATTLDGIFLKKFKKEYVYCDPRVIQEYQRLENTAKYQFQNTYLYDPCFLNASTNEPSSNEIKMTYLNINGLMDYDHFECLQNDINLMSSDIICIAETKIAGEDDINVDLKDFDIVYCIDNEHQDKSMGMIIYKRKSMPTFQIEMLQTASYQTMVCYLPCGIVWFVYINPHKNSFQQTDLINKISEYSKNDQLLSVIGDLNITSEMGSDIFKKLRLKSALQSRKHNLNAKLDYVLMRDDINLEKYSAGTFKNLYTDNKSLFLRISTDPNDVFKTANAHNTDPEARTGEGEGEENGDNQATTGGAAQCENTEKNKSVEEVTHNESVEEDTDNDNESVEEDTDNDTSLESIANNNPDIQDVIRFDNSRGHNNCWLNCVIRVLAHMLQLLPNQQSQNWTSITAMSQAFMDYLSDIAINMNAGGKLCVDTINVPYFIGEQPNFISAKQLFSLIIINRNFNTANQQDASEALTLFFSENETKTNP